MFGVGVDVDTDVVDFVVDVVAGAGKPPFGRPCLELVTAHDKLALLIG